MISFPERHLGDFIKAARLCPKVCSGDAKRWEDWIFVFSEKRQLQVFPDYTHHHYLLMSSPRPSSLSSLLIHRDSII